MNTKIIVAAVVLLVGGTASYVLLSHSHTTAPEASDDPHAGHFMQSTDQHADHLMHMTVTSEREFVAGMIPHHQEAVDTAREVLARGGTTPEIRDLAERIIAAQEAEIADLQAWHLDWYGEAYEDDGSYHPMMRDLSTRSGVDLDRVFLADMIPHHEGAITMAESVLTLTQRPEMLALANDIITSQQAEIAEMEALLQTLPQ